MEAKKKWSKDVKELSDMMDYELSNIKITIDELMKAFERLNIKMEKDNIEFEKSKIYGGI